MNCLCTGRQSEQMSAIHMKVFDLHDISHMKPGSIQPLKMIAITSVGCPLWLLYKTGLSRR